MEKIDLTIRAAECCNVCQYFDLQGGRRTSLKGTCLHPDLEKPRPTRREGTCDGFKQNDKGGVARRVLRQSCTHEQTHLVLEYKSQENGKYYTDKMPRLKLSYTSRCLKCNSIAGGRGYSWTIFKYAQQQDRTGKFYFTDDLNPDYELVLCLWKKLKKGSEPLPEIIAKPEWSRYW